VQHLQRLSKARSHRNIASQHRIAASRSSRRRAPPRAGDAKRLTDAFTKLLTPG
jgi:hypothetical protein